VRGAPRSGATWAPVYISYGASNRTQMIRVPATGRFEIRVVDGAANPYLAFAGIVAAGLDGINQKIDPGPMNHDNLYEASEQELKARGIGVLPGTLTEALDAFAQDPVIQGALGANYSKEYFRVKNDEWWTHSRAVSSWERDYYLGTY
jgi:glutamine synthetase